MKINSNYQLYSQRFPQKGNTENNSGTNLFKKHNNIQNQNVNFGGKLDKIFDPISKLYAKIAKSPKMDKFISKIAEKSDSLKILSVGTGLLISGLYMYNTAKSKKIEEDQKRPLIINQAAVSLVSAGLGWVLDSKLNEFYIEKVIKPFEKANIKMPNNEMDKCIRGLGAAKTLIIFTAIYRYFSPVVLTPVANKISNYLDERDAKNLQKNGKKIA